MLRNSQQRVVRTFFYRSQQRSPLKIMFLRTNAHDPKSLFQIEQNVYFYGSSENRSKKKTIETLHITEQSATQFCKYVNI